jgi:hypothetical protein
VDPAGGAPQNFTSLRIRLNFGHNVKKSCTQTIG